MVRIICIGNRFAYPDNFGILVYEKLKTLELVDIEIVEGGVGGDSLSLYFEDDAKVLIVDYAIDMPKYAKKEDILALDIKEYSHANSLIYFLKMVQKDYWLYLCSEEFDDIDKYVDEILEYARKLI